MTRELILNAHSLCGILVFATGFLQLILKKGGRPHRLLGKAYLIGWLFLLFSGAYLGGALITIVGIFGFYFALTGGRLAALKNKAFTWFDKGFVLTGLLLSLAMLFYAVQLYLRGDTSFAIIFAVFGALFLLSTVQDLFKYLLNKPLKADKYGRMDWFFEHLVRMQISFIAALTAFASIQDVFGNNTLNFLLPTVFGVAAIAVYKKRYEARMLEQ